jgi:HSP20 family protein
MPFVSVETEYRGEAFKGVVDPKGETELAWDEDEFFRKWRERRRIFSPFEAMDKLMKEMDRWFEEEMKEFERMFPSKLFRERRAPDGSIIREYGPLIFGYSITIGPDGKPIIRQFGNVKPRPGEIGVKEVREPLVDVFETDREVKVIAELPGAEKEQIHLSGTKRTLTIEVKEKGEVKYYKEVDLPSQVDPRGAKSTYKNGILEVTLPKARDNERGSHTIPVG